MTPILTGLSGGTLFGPWPLLPRHTLTSWEERAHFCGDEILPPFGTNLRQQCGRLLMSGILFSQNPFRLQMTPPQAGVFTSRAHEPCAAKRAVVERLSGLAALLMKRLCLALYEIRTVGPFRSARKSCRHDYCIESFGIGESTVKRQYLCK